MLAIRLPSAIEERLAALAKRTGRSKSWYVRQAILAHLDALENRYLAEGAQTPAVREPGADYARPDRTPEGSASQLGLGPEELAWLEREARARHMSPTELVRQALDSWRAQQEAADRATLNSILKRTAGIWRHGDGLAWQRTMRDEWDRKP